MSPFASELGVRQGDNLSSKFFSVYIDGLINRLQSSPYGLTLKDNTKMNVLAYADDLVLLANSEGDLQQLLDIASQWCRSWGVSVNTQKTKIMHFRQKRNKLTDFKFVINSQELEIVATCKYLGVIVDDKLEMDTTIEQQSLSGTRSLVHIIGTMRSNYDLGFDSFSQLYHSCVVPVMEYSIGSWHRPRSNMYNSWTKYSNMP